MGPGVSGCSLSRQAACDRRRGPGSAAHGPRIADQGAGTRQRGPGTRQRDQVATSCAPGDAVLGVCNPDHKHRRPGDTNTNTATATRRADHGSRPPAPGPGSADHGHQGADQVGRHAVRGPRIRARAAGLGGLAWPPGGRAGLCLFCIRSQGARYDTGRKKARHAAGLGSGKTGQLRQAGPQLRPARPACGRPCPGRRPCRR